MMISVEGWKPQTSVSYDLAMTSCGFERRSSHLIRRGLTARRQVAFTFSRHRTLNYSDNRRITEAAGYEVLDPESGAFRLSLRPVLESFAAKMERTASTGSLAVDISSMTRVRLAETVAELRRLGRRGLKLRVDFLYSPGDSARPPLDAGVLVVRPVTEEFRGALRPATLPLGAVMGLGHEPKRALGAYELIEPAHAWAFQPFGHNGRYEKATGEVNRQFLALIKPESRLAYPILSPVETYYRVESFVYAATHFYRLVLVPMGPKVFALACLLVAADGHDRPAVWRVGESSYHIPLDSVETGEVVGLTATFAHEQVAGRVLSIASSIEGG